MARFGRRLTAQPAVGPHTPRPAGGAGHGPRRADLAAAIDPVLASYLGSPAHLALLQRWSAGTILPTATGAPAP
jgi:hypothetical protein